ncbi:MAG TPA: DUF6691 family protein [Desulfobacterales bacterium]|nr:DUF6691 family protein [Desulfobacterales bacterium]
MGPLYKLGWFDFAYSLQLAALIGFFFGFVLERAGFGNPRKLTAIFYLRDFAVLKVMFTAIVVCILGLLYFSVFGWIDLSRVHILPTYIWPQIVGGLLLGVGFLIGGYCPTTSVVATASGKLDGLIFILGMVFGSLIFAQMFPLIQGFYTSGHMGAIRLPDILKINSGIVALLVCLLAVGAFWIAEKTEGKFGNKQTLPVGSAKIKRTGATLLILLGLILAVINPDRPVYSKSSIPVQTPKETEKIQPVPPKADIPSSHQFKIVDDEGC